MCNVLDLGKLSNLTPNEVWKNEEAFSEWLRENFNLLADEIGIIAEGLETEMSVGRMSCDITGIDTSTRRSIVVENQFGTSDHDHLGKVLTYSAGLDAGVVVWIAERFKDEHLSVLEWLNRRTDSTVSFFGATLNVLQIDDSNPAPDIQIVLQPYEWQRALKQSDFSEKKMAYIEFFGKLIQKIREDVPTFANVRKPLPQNWISVGAGKTGVLIVFVFGSDGHFKVELGITPGNRERAIELYKGLEKERASIDQEIPDLIWRHIGNTASIGVVYGKPMDVFSALEEPEASRMGDYDWGTFQRSL